MAHALSAEQWLSKRIILSCLAFSRFELLRHLIASPAKLKQVIIRF